MLTDAVDIHARDSVVEPRISYVIARLERAVRAAIGERVKPYGLTTSQYTTLSVVGARSGLSNAQLARRAYMTPQSMSEVIEALETRGLIERARARRSRSRAPGDPDAQGAPGARPPATGAVDELEEEMLRDLSADERALLVEGLTSAVRALHAGLPER